MIYSGKVFERSHK